MKIRAAHILIDTKSERETASIHSMSKIADYGIDYVPYITQKYTGDVWKYQTPYDGWLRHGPAHFGLYRSAQSVVYDYFTEDLDAFMIFEADCVIGTHISYERFANEVYRAVEFSRKHNNLLFSFGSRYCNDVLQSPIINTDSDYTGFVLTDKIIMTHCILMVKQNRELILTEFLHSPWDGLDIWFNSVFYKNRHKHNLALGITEYPYTYQYEGMSMIDGEIKGTRE